MNKYFYYILPFFGMYFLFFIAFLFWSFGYLAYGADASIIFAGVMLSLIAIVSLFKEVYSRQNTKPLNDGETLNRYSVYMDKKDKAAGNIHNIIKKEVEKRLK